jgi:hypothetical protein
MERTVKGIALAACLFFVGCAGNQLKVDNETGLSLDFLFRGNRYAVAANSRQIIEDIPNGVFDYSSGLSLPSGYTYSDGGGLSGTLSFKQSKTEVLIIYSATLTDKTYKVSAVTTSNVSGGVVGP